MLMHKLAAVFTGIVLGVVVPDAFSPHAQRPPSETRGDTGVKLSAALLQLGKSCECFFTIEEASRGDETANSIQAGSIPESILHQSPRQVIDQMRATLPNFTYEVDKLDSRIIHIRDKRLLGLRQYALDEEVGTFDFSGPLYSLVNALAKEGIPIADAAVLANEQLDFHTQVHVKGKSMQVRTALSNFIPLGAKEKGPILWIAWTRLDEKHSITTVRFPL